MECTARQVFTKLKVEDTCPWQPPPRMRRNPYMEPFWLQLLQLSTEPELAPAAEVPVVAAARQLLTAAEMGAALATLVTDPRGLLPTAGIFSELCWQVEDRSVLQQIAAKMEESRVRFCSHPLAFNSTSRTDCPHALQNYEIELHIHRLCLPKMHPAKSRSVTSSKGGGPASSGD